MSVKSSPSPRPVREKRVSFSVYSEKAEYSRHPRDTPSSRQSNSSVEISAFPQAEIKSILRLNLSNLDSPRTGTKKTPRRKKRKTVKKEVKSRTSKRVQSFKEPTETVKHALLRSMSHREPDEATRRFVSKVLTFQPPKLIETLPVKPLETPRSSRDLPEVICTSTKLDQSDVSIFCGHCKRGKRRVVPAAGFCKYCMEYLCAQCVVHHKGRLTRTHPVVVFYCHKCKEPRVLNDRGAGHCVECKNFYCSRCVVEHCSKTEHRILEGADLKDVVDCIIQQ